ncbi:MAG TPA: glycosyltransferase, partial [Planctomycetaceae bacterium]|nr:glycosyltransferase [Planctomycetaceae bacterium]
GADAVVTVSRDMAQTVSSYGVTPEKIHTIYNGIDKQLFARGSKAIAREHLHIHAHDKLLLWVGRMVPVKGLDNLLKAVRFLSDEKLGVTVALVGSGPLEQSLRQEAEALKISAKIRFEGDASHADLPDWYRAADATVLPSLSEGIPNVLLESISCGTSFVASRVGGIPEIATEPIDRLVPAGNPQALARAICDSLDRNRSSDHQRQFEPTAWSVSAERLAELFQSAIDRKKNNLSTVSYAS